MVAILTLGLNGWRLDVTERDAIATFRAVAEGSLEEPALAAWLEAGSTRG